MGEKVTVYFGKPRQLVAQLVSASEGNLQAEPVALLAIAIQLERIADLLSERKEEQKPPVDSN